MNLHPRLTAEGVLLARRAERFRPVAEHDGRGWVVGYGHRASAREGAQVSEADATALLAYDLSQSAARVERLLGAPVSPAVFDALNARAFRLGPASLAGSDVLRRLNAGEPLSAADLAAEDQPRDDAPPAAVTVAAQAVRERLSQVLTDPEPLPPRPPREPWPDAPASAPAPGPWPAPGPFDAKPAEPDEARTPQAPALEPQAEPATPTDAFGPRPSVPVRNGESAHVDARAPRDEAPAEEPAPFPAAPEETTPHADTHAPDAAALAPDAPAADPLATTVVDDTPEPPASLPTAVPWRGSPPVPLVSFVRGGRPKMWDRVRGNAYVYMAIGACGVVLFACALLGFLLGRPTGPGLALGVVGVICLAPALAFFLHRRGGGGSADPIG